ncbi:MAG: phosphatidylserine/phosphatidylglycerophosphate/cardiolipin synthase family protein [Firmicutes bacterium]|nr:phosphatidylserine/phosphatidylglycerophosphate/cardiolipin synthase family protein [Bacillota bacterium]
MAEKKSKIKVRKRKKKTLWIVLASVGGVLLLTLAYLAAIVLPYAGGLKVSEVTKAAYAKENFLGGDEADNPERVYYIPEKEDAFMHRIKTIEQAKERIYISYYTIEPDRAGKIFLGALFSAADRGVKVQILVDGKKWGLNQKAEQSLSGHPNIELYKYNEPNIFLPHKISPQLHDKIHLIDNRFFLTGSRNVNDRYYYYDEWISSGRGDTSDGTLLTDADILVYNTDPDEFYGVISEGAAYYERLIADPASKKITRKPNAAFQKIALESYQEYRKGDPDDPDYLALSMPVKKISLITNTINAGKKEPIVAYNLLSLARESDSVLIRSPYICLTKENLKVFGEIAKTASEFTMLTNCPQNYNVVMPYANYHVNRASYVKAGLSIYEWQNDHIALHAKAYIYDNRLTAIGSFNLDERSIRNDTESMLVIDSEEFAALIRAETDNHLKSALKVNQKGGYEPSETVQKQKVSGGNKFVLGFVGFFTNLAIWIV